MAFTHAFDPTILREYDIRGIVGRTLHDQDAFAIGRTFGSIVARSGGTTVAVGYDGRISSPELEPPLVEGLKASGMEVIRVGLGPTPMLYYAGTTMKTDGAVMLTGSHNPPDYNGFKMMLGGKPFFGPQIRDIGGLAAAGRRGGRERPAATGCVDVSADYIARVASDYDGGSRPLKVVWDNGNGAAGEVLDRLVKRLPGTHTVLFPDIDGRFPNHHPDPTVPKNLEALIAEVAQRGADLGIALDGDADRIGVVDDTGGIMFGDQLLVVLARDVLKARPGATIIADVKASQVLFDEVAKAGGKPLMWRTGHSLIKAKMAETGAPLAGEMSGHIFFADKWYGFDDALYSAVRLLGIVARTSGKLSAVRSALPHVVNTPELRFNCDDVRKFAVIEEVAARLKAAGAKLAGHRRRPGADRGRLVAAARLQHPGGAGRPRRGRHRGRAGAAETRLGRAVAGLRAGCAGLLRRKCRALMARGYFRHRRGGGLEVEKCRRAVAHRACVWRCLLLHHRRRLRRPRRPPAPIPPTRRRTCRCGASPRPTRWCCRSGCVLVGVEMLEDAAELPSFRHPLSAAYVLGPERHGLSPAMLARCRYVVRIPTRFAPQPGGRRRAGAVRPPAQHARFAERPVTPRRRRTGGRRPDHGHPVFRRNVPDWAEDDET